MADQFQTTLALGEVSRRAPMADNLVGSKGSVFYRAHSYHTKVPVETIVQLIEHYTDPGAVVLDPFCGSGQTGVAALLTGRHAILSDLSPAAVHIARGYTSRVNPARFERAATELLTKLAPLEQELYGVPQGKIEYTVWSDVFQCLQCGHEILFWDSAVDHEAGTVSKSLFCPVGHGPYKKTELHWLRTQPVQENISFDGQRTRLVRPLAALAERHWIDRYGINGHGIDHCGINQRGIDRNNLPHWYPSVPWDSWREMWRVQHKNRGIKTSADFFTARNLYALSELWNAIGQMDEKSIRAGLRFVFTATVNRASRRYQWNPKRPTNVLSSTMYLASLNYEFNVFSLFRRKLATITDMYTKTWEASGSCEVHLGSATELHWAADASVDYVFTDPPFGSNIFYSDSSFLWEAWLGVQTDVAAETVVNKRLPVESGRTTLDDYEKAMRRAMEEIRRVMRSDAWVSMQFHNSDDAVWSAIQSAVDAAGLGVAAAVVMDKGQSSFKGLRHEGKGEKVANFDVVMHLAASTQARFDAQRRQADQGEIKKELAEYVAHQPASRRTTPWLHSQVMRYLIASGASPAGWNFAAVESLCGEFLERRSNAWQLPTVDS